MGDHKQIKRFLVCFGSGKFAVCKKVQSSLCRTLNSFRCLDRLQLFVSLRKCFWETERVAHFSPSAGVCVTFSPQPACFSFLLSVKVLHSRRAHSPFALSRSRFLRFAFRFFISLRLYTRQKLFSLVESLFGRVFLFGGDFSFLVQRKQNFMTYQFNTKKRRFSVAAWSLRPVNRIKKKESNKISKW